MNVGDRIRVTESVIVYHHPQNRKVGFDIKGMEGEITEIIPRPITANLPIKVKFDGKFSAHLHEQEIELV